MSFLYDEMVVIFMGGFIVLAAKKCKITIPLWTEILGMLLGLGVVWLLQENFGWFSHITFMEQVRFVLIGYIPGRLVFRRKKKDE